VETKEQFSDGVGYEWIDQLKHCASTVTDEQLAGSCGEFPLNPPTTKSLLVSYYIFHKHYPQKLMLLKQLESGYQDDGKKIQRSKGRANMLVKRKC
jgi:hypothetical protein